MREQSARQQEIRGRFAGQLPPYSQDCRGGDSSSAADVVVYVDVSLGLSPGITNSRSFNEKSAFDLGQLGLSRVLSVPNQRHFPE